MREVLQKKPKPEFNGPNLVSKGAAAVVSPQVYEVYSSTAEGDWEMAYFELQTPVKLHHVQAAAKDTWHKWEVMKDREKKQLTSKPSVFGPFYIPEYGKLGDLARYFIVARWKRLKPVIIRDIDLAQEIAEAETPANLVWLYIENLRRFSGLPLDVAERQARENAEMGRVAEAEAELWEELNYLRAHRPARRTA